MNQFLAKLRLILVPFIVVSVCTLIIYTFLNWLLLIQFHTFDVSDDVVNLFIPMALPWLPLLIWIRPRIKLLKLNVSGRKDPVTGLLLLTWITMAIPIVIAQMYLVTATGKLTPLKQMSEIIHLPATKYYTVKQFYVSKKFAHIKPAFAVSGKYNNDFDMSIYVAVPVFDRVFPDTTRITAMRDSLHKNALVILNGQLSTMQQLKRLPADSIASMRFLNPSLVMPKYGNEGQYGALLVLTISYHNPHIKLPPFKMAPAAWIGVKYRKTISNHLSPEEKEQSYKEFALQSENEFEAEQLGRFTYLDRLAYGTDLKNYKKAIASRDDVIGDDPVILSAVNEPFANHNGSKLPWIFGSFAIGTAIFLIILQFIKLRTDISLKESNPHKSQALDWGQITHWFLPRVGFAATPVIIDLNILMFAIMMFSGLGFMSFDAPDLLQWGANFRPAIANGECWRLVTNMFLHGGIMHILFNMYGLIFVGIFLEPLLGTYKYAVIYLVTGVVASLASVWWHPATVSVGASGAIFGLYGVFLALLTTNLFPKEFKKSFLLSTSIFVGYNLLFGLTGGIDNAAHIGGLISGLLFGYALYPSLKNKARMAEAEITTEQLMDGLTNKEEE